MPKLIPLTARAEPASRPILIPPRIWEELDSYEKNLQHKFIRAFRFLSRDPGHPSLSIEVIKGQAGTIYRARVDLQYRMHFELRNDYYAILAVGPHRLQGIG